MLNWFTTYDSVKGRYNVNTFGVMMIIVLILALIALALALQPKEMKSKKFTALQLAFSGAALALAMVISLLPPLYQMPMGGSVTLCSMFFITFIGYLYGPKAGLMTGIAYGFMQFLIKPVFHTMPQMLVDYPLAFGALGLSGFFTNKKYGLQIGYIVGVFGRFVFAFLSGLLFFAEYAADWGMSAPAYAAAYNITYILPEAFLTLVIICLPPVTQALKHTKRISQEQERATAYH